MAATKAKRKAKKKTTTKASKTGAQSRGTKKTSMKKAAQAGPGKKISPKKAARKETPAVTAKTGKTASKRAPRAKTSVSADFPGYGKDAVVFLAELRMNNDRDWFKANQERYEASVREPTRAFIRAMAPRLAQLSKHLVASDKKVGGSMMRPQRDTRFAKDADPYKTNVGVQFRNQAGKNVHAPGYYFHFDPDSVFIGAGMWHPEADALTKIRKHIHAHSKRWSEVLSASAFRSRFELRGDALKRPPKGYDADHPMIEHLKRKDHIAVANLDHDLLYSEHLVAELANQFKAAKPFMALLHEAIGVSF